MKLGGVLMFAAVMVTVAWLGIAPAVGAVARLCQVMAAP